jgi:2,4-dienoyl-CoA reductase-like NADH-dependent reductase (Old Yellow Enzyme family)
VKLRRLRDAAALRDHAEGLGVDLPLQEDAARAAEALAAPLPLPGVGHAGNRFAVLPMEGWDAAADGSPSALVERRWRRFGESGAKLVWGGEAVAVRPDGRANPNQLVLQPAHERAFAALREILVDAHRERHGRVDDLVVGLQLTHSGRFARPEGAPRPRIAYRHPWLDARVGADDAAVLDDGELDALVDAFVAAGVRAARLGFDFVDVKHCHGYLGHELLSAVDRPGPYGGDLTGRTRLLRRIVEGLRSEAPRLAVGVRLSIFDLAPFRPGPDGVGVCEVAEGEAYPWAFGGDGSGRGIDLAEPAALLELLRELGVRLVCTTAGSPYYVPHVQRPAFYPPSDGYQPPEDPLAGVVRQIRATEALRRRAPELVFVGSGYSYLQEWLPAVAGAAVAEGRVDAVGVGRMALSYPELPADVLAGRALDGRRICRTFSDCTTAPRGGLVSGCYPLDPFYGERPEAKRLAERKRAARSR